MRTDHAVNSPVSTIEMKRYKSAEWNFALDVPKRWNAFPPVSTNSPLEVIRFASKEDGTHLVIIFRGPREPNQPLKEICQRAQGILTKHGFRNFTTTQTAIGSRAVLLLEFDRPWSPRPRSWAKSRHALVRALETVCNKLALSRQGEGTWSCREYFLADGTLQYTLGFGTTNKDGMFDLYDRMAKSFEFSAE